MSDKFSFMAKLRDSTKTAVFQSETGDEYYVDYITNKIGEVVLTVEWLIPRRNTVKVELFTEDSIFITSQIGLGTEKQACLKFSVANKQDDVGDRNMMFIITVIPYVEIEDRSTSSRDTRVAININDEQIKDLSEDLLIGLAMDMRDLFIHGDLSDAIITNGDYIVKVHAAILSARSAVFREIFRQPLSEKAITVPGASAGALEDMVVFLYSGFIKIKDYDRAEELYVLANEYEIEDLLDVSSIYMSNYTVDSVLKTLILAEKHQDFHLKKSSIDFILRNLGELKSSDKWASFAENNSDLVSEIFSYVSGISEKDTLQAFISRLSSKQIKI